MMHLLVAQMSLSQNFRFENKLYKLLNTFPLNNNLGPFLINRDGSFLALRKKEHVRAGIKLPPLGVQQCLEFGGLFGG